MSSRLEELEAENERLREENKRLQAELELLRAGRVEEMTVGYGMLN